MVVALQPRLLRGVLVLVRLPGVPGVGVIVIGSGIMSMGMAVLMPMVMAMGMGMGMAVGDVPMAMGMGVHVGVRMVVAVPMLVTVLPGALVIGPVVAAVHVRSPVPPSGACG